MSMSLADNAQRTRAAFLDGLKAGRSETDIAKDLAALDEAARKSLADLRGLSARAGLQVRLDDLDGRQRQFTETLRDMLAAHFRGQTSEAVTRDRLTKSRSGPARVRRSPDRPRHRGRDQDRGERGQGQDPGASRRRHRRRLGDLFSQTLNETLPAPAGRLQADAGHREAAGAGRLLRQSDGCCRAGADRAECEGHAAHRHHRDPGDSADGCERRKARRRSARSRKA